jgi:hypothetical protein
MPTDDHPEPHQVTGRVCWRLVELGHNDDNTTSFRFERCDGAH